MVPPTCTATDVSALRWVLHANHNYYVTIKVTNLAGLTTLETSHPYKHNVRIPSPGVVYDVSPLSTSSSSFAVSNDCYSKSNLYYDPWEKEKWSLETDDLLKVVQFL